MTMIRHKSRFDATFKTVRTVLTDSWRPLSENIRKVGKLKSFTELTAFGLSGLNIVTFTFIDDDANATHQALMDLKKVMAQGDELEIKIDYLTASGEVSRMLKLKNANIGNVEYSDLDQNAGNSGGNWLTIAVDVSYESLEDVTNDD